MTSNKLGEGVIKSRRATHSKCGVAHSSEGVAEVTSSNVAMDVQELEKA